MTSPADRPEKTGTGKPGPPHLYETREGTVVRLHVQPRASRTALSGLHGAALKLRVQAPPVEGAANEACRKFLARILGVPASNVRLASGAHSREKAFLLQGVPLEKARRLLG